MKHIGVLLFALLMLSAGAFAIVFNMRKQLKDTEYVSIQHGREHLILEIPEEFIQINKDTMYCYRSNDTIRLEFINSKTTKDYK